MGVSAGALYKTAQKSWYEHSPRPKMSDNGCSTVSKHIPTTPPPTLVSDKSWASNAKSYTRDLLLSLATPKAQPPARPRIESVSRLLRQNSVWQWGMEEEASTVLDGGSLSKGMPIPKQAELIGTPGQGYPADILFNFRSTPGDAAVPILIDFANPSPFDNVREKTSPKAIDPASLGIRLGARTSSFSRSNPSTISDSSLARRVSSITCSPLNPFAPPFQNGGAGKMTTSDSSQTFRTLPASLPKKPDAPLPPVFVKRESAALPQPMALPDVAPMGSAWEGEASLSGNEKRRRASSIGSDFSDISLSSRSTQRPARLVNLGEKVRQNSMVFQST